jgi:Chitobiase/beta-hexosaminidase C-terminal domain
MSGGFEAKANWLSRRASFLALSLVLASLLTVDAISVSIAAPLPKVETPRFSPAGGTYSSPQNITISCNTPGATIRYTLDGTTPTSVSQNYSKPIFLNATTTIKAIASANRYRDSDVASATYTINLPKVATPTFNPPGGTYYSAQSVAIQCTTQGATIRYTTNGGEPSTSSLVYSSPIPVSTTTTLKAKAFKTDWLDSNTASATYNIKVATPTFSPAGGTYTSPQSVIIQCATIGATIRYTTDGSIPSSSSPVFSGSVMVGSSATVRAKAFNIGMVDSDIANATYIINIPIVATPTFSPAGGTYSSPQEVVIQCATIGATIRYTTDGSAPSSSSPIFPGSIMISSSATVRAKAFKIGMLDSDTASTTYIISIPKVTTPSFNPGGGTYDVAQSVALLCNTSGAAIRYTTDGSEPSSASPIYSSPIQVSSNITLKAKAFKAGMLDSDTGSAKYIIIVPKVATPTFNPSGGNYSASQSVALICGTSGATIRYTTNGSDPNLASTIYIVPILLNVTSTIKAKAFMTGMTESDTAVATFVINIPKVSSPTFNPGGGSYNSAQNVSIACGTGGATIRFTVDGSNPVSSSTVYSAPIAVATNMTIKARAFMAGWTDSDVATATYVVVILQPPKVAIPTFSPGAGTYVLSATVTVNCATAGATVRYTTDGAEPSASSAAYSVPILVNSNITVKAKAFKAGMVDSDTATATYKITIPKVATPTFALGAGTYSAAQTVSLTCSTAGATIRFTIDGSNPSSSSASYSTPIAIAANITVKAKAFVAGWTDSDTASATYVIVVLPPPKVLTPVFNPSGGSYSSSQNVSLSCSTVGATIRYSLDGSDPGSSSAAYSTPILVNSNTTIKARALLSGMTVSDTATATYTIITGAQEPTNTTTKVATPAFTPVGGTYSSSQNVELSCATSEATIRFTVDGSEPSSYSAIYSTPIVVRATTTVKAKGFAAGMNNSDTATATYTITVVGGKVATPTFDPWGGDYSSAQTVNIQCATAGATIRYTINGDQPSPSSPVYSGPIWVNVSTTIKARAFLDGMTDSDTASTMYAIDLERAASANPFLGVGFVYPLVAVVAVVALVGGVLFLKFGRISGNAKEIEVEPPANAEDQVQSPLPVSVEPERIETPPPIGIVQQPVPKPESIDLKRVEPQPPSSSIQEPVPVVENSQPVGYEILKCPSCGKECSKKEYDDGLCWRCELLEFEKRCSR